MSLSSPEERRNATGGELQSWQAAKMRDALFAATNYLVRMKERMHERRFPPQDRLYLLVCKTHVDLVELSMRLHYVACGQCVGEPPRK
jgi:hypothetical protein